MIQLAGIKIRLARPSCVSVGPGFWSRGGRDGRDHFRLQPRPESRRDPELSDNSRSPLQRHPQQIRSLLKARHLHASAHARRRPSPIFLHSDGLVMFSCRIVCETTSSGSERSGHASVQVREGGVGLSAQIFSFQVKSTTATVLWQRLWNRCFIFNAALANMYAE